MQEGRGICHRTVVQISACALRSDDSGICAGAGPQSPGKMDAI
jgi:hypothetical protein